MGLVKWFLVRHMPPISLFLLRMTIKALAEFTKLKINDYAQYIGEQAVQLHGGMGVSDELDIAHYFRRLTTIRHLLGDQSYCLSQLVNDNFK